ncbi:hypothetical protein EV356DRAFT_537165 [Viridothelium virens]|uniref:Uncharacterized protein n=1 Tax=Viridothelium virens TaxID=1048519 RepID=A0A6A6GV07_VIRVR|nr:hypothetical protein EV356DRAFT_537165 [Viridothelium virens]
MTLELETINGERWADSGQAELIVEREEFEGDDRELVGSEGEGNDVEIGKVTFQAWAAVEEAKKPENAAWESEPDEETAAEGEGKARFNPRRWAGKAGKMLKKIRPRTPA